MVLQLPYPPTANTYWRLCHGRIVKSKEARHYQGAVQMLARAQMTRAGYAPFGDAEIAISLHFRRPHRRGDLDNSLKVLLDALKGVAFDDDRQVASITATRGLDAANPGVVVTVEVLR
jgi:crossover junction endodeoxyribonuclease RusA